MNLSKKITVFILSFGVVQLFSMHRSIKKPVVKKLVEESRVVVTWNPVCEVPVSRVTANLSNSIEMTDNSPLTIGHYDEGVNNHYRGYSECMRRDFEEQQAEKIKEFIQRKVEEAKLREKMLHDNATQAVCKQCLNVKDCLYCGRGGANDCESICIEFKDEK